MQVLANFLSTPLASGIDGNALGLNYVAFDLDLSIVKVSVICQIQKALLLIWLNWMILLVQGKQF